MSRNFIALNNASLKQFNSMRLDAKCENMLFPLNEEGLAEALREFKDKRIIILGNGSNVIFKREYYGEDTAFIITSMLNDIYEEDGIIFAQSGVTLSRLSWFALEKSVTGFEFCEDIPGTVGGGIIMNAGTYKDTLGGVANTVYWYSPSNDKFGQTTVNTDILQKRNLVLPYNDAVVLKVSFNTKSGNYEEILDKMLYVKKDRYLKQPRNYPSAGSVFKRPLKDGKLLEVWKLIENAGLRGFTIGDAQVSEKHTGFIVNKGKATGADLVSVAMYCQKTVKEKFGIELELEWKLI